MGKDLPQTSANGKQVAGFWKPQHVLDSRGLFKGHSIGLNWPEPGRGDNMVLEINLQLEKLEKLEK